MSSEEAGAGVSGTTVVDVSTFFGAVTRIAGEYSDATAGGKFGVDTRGVEVLDLGLAGGDMWPLFDGGVSDLSSLRSRFLLRSSCVSIIDDSVAGVFSSVACGS